MPAICFLSFTAPSKNYAWFNSVMKYFPLTFYDWLALIDMITNSQWTLFLPVQDSCEIVRECTRGTKRVSSPEVVVANYWTLWQVEVLKWNHSLHITFRHLRRNDGRIITPYGFVFKHLVSDTVWDLRGSLGRGNYSWWLEERICRENSQKRRPSKLYNYRGIASLSVPGKILSRIIVQRLIDALDEIFRDQQIGFRTNRSCTHYITTLRIIAEQSLEWNSSLYITFIDFEKTFHRVDHDVLWKILHHYGIPKKFISMMQNSYYNSQIRVIHNRELSAPFLKNLEFDRAASYHPCYFFWLSIG